MAAAVLLLVDPSFLARLAVELSPYYVGAQFGADELT
jgi:hypothetical protein